MNIRLKSLTVQDYRCFGGIQTVRLAPITLLVGENSSGKTSLLTMIRALWDSAFTPFPGAPDFKEHPFDLGSFDEIIHRGSRAQRFKASLDLEYSPNEETAAYEVEVDFIPQWGPPVIGRRRVSNDGCWIEQRVEAEGYMVRYGTPNGSWSSSLRMESGSEDSSPNEAEHAMPLIAFDLMFARHIHQQKEESALSLFIPIEDSPKITRKDLEYIDRSLGKVFRIERLSPLGNSRPLLALLYDLSPNALMIGVKYFLTQKVIIHLCI